ncbi:MAG: hypothetical protein WA708_14650, partial [Acidobacteriaceae bacterium]
MRYAIAADKTQTRNGCEQERNEREVRIYTTKGSRFHGMALPIKLCKEWHEVGEDVLQVAIKAVADRG